MILKKWFWSVLVFSSWVFAAKQERQLCASYIENLRKMNQAHESLMISYANSYESFATTLQNQSEQYHLLLNERGGLTQQDLDWLDKNAGVYRSAGQKSRLLIQQYNQQTSELISHLTECLKKL